MSFHYKSQARGIYPTSKVNFLISCFEPSTWLVAVKVLRNISIHAILDLINASNSQPALMVRDLV